MSEGGVHAAFAVGRSHEDRIENSDAQDLTVQPATTLPMEPLFGRSLPRWKRVKDIVISALGLVLLSPLFLLLAVYIKLVSPGPVFFRQQRVGYLGREFRLWKFRSMHPGAGSSTHKQLMAELIRGESGTEGAPMRKLECDPRIIPLGTLFRKSCLDELPQLINILRGDMSLIGPRPAIPYEVVQYQHWHKWRFDVVPGLTGLWQVSGKNDLTFKQMVRLDIRYARELSVGLDTRIFFRTFPTIFTQLTGRKPRQRSAAQSHLNTEQAQGATGGPLRPQGPARPARKAAHGDVCSPNSKDARAEMQIHEW